MVCQNLKDIEKPRAMKLAEKFNIPILTFIDTPGAYPGIDAESRNQSIAIADNLYEMSKIKCPIISVVIGREALEAL